MATIVNNNQNQNKDEPLKQPYTPTGPAFVGTGAGQPAQQKAGGQSQFTGINQFLNANKNAAGQLGGAVQGGVQKQIGAQKVGAEKEVKDVSTQGQALTGLVGQGTAFQQQLADQNQAIKLGQDQNQLKDFTGLRTGATQQAAANQLNTESQQAQGAVQNLANQAQQRLQQLGTSQGRTGLLQEFAGAGKKNYDTGSYSKLDQALLQRDKTGALGQARNVVQNVKEKDVGGLQNTFKEQLDAANKAKEQAMGLQGTLDTRAGELESKFVTDLGSKVESVNAARAKEQKDAEMALSAIRGKSTTASGEDVNKYIADQGIDLGDYMNKFGLQAGTQTFGFFDDPNFNQDAYIQKSLQQARGAADVANEQDVTNYRALANLAKSGLKDGALVGPTEDQLALTKAGNLEQALSIAKDASGRTKLASGLDTAAQDFLTRAMGTDVAGYGRDSYDGGLLGGGSGVKEATARDNLGRILQAGGFDPNMIRTQNPNVLESTASGTINPTLNLLRGKAPSTALDAIGAINPLQGGFLSGLNNILGGTFGSDAQGGAQGAADARAKQDLQANMMARLKEMGYGNVLGARGQINAFDQQRAAAEAQQELDRFTKQGPDAKQENQMLARLGASTGAQQMFTGGQLSELFNKFKQGGMDQYTGLDPEQVAAKLGVDFGKERFMVRGQGGQPDQMMLSDKGRQALGQIAGFQQYASGLKDQEAAMRTRATSTRQALNDILGTVIPPKAENTKF